MLGQDILTQAEFDKFYESEYLVDQAACLNVIAKYNQEILRNQKLIKLSATLNIALVLLASILIYLK